MEKLIIRNDNCCVVLDNDNKVMSGIISEKYLIKDINFNNLPPNIFKDVSLYFNENVYPYRKYESYNIDLIDIQNLLFTHANEQTGGKFYKNDRFMYSYSRETFTIYISHFNVLSVLDIKYSTTSNSSGIYMVFKLICAELLKNRYEWIIDNIEITPA